MKNVFKSKGFRDFIYRLKTIIIFHRHSIELTLPFIAMDLITRIFAFKTKYFQFYYPVPLLFTIVWVILIVGIAVSLRGMFGKIFYWLMFSFYFIMYLTNNIYYSLTSFFFSFNLLKVAGEGMDYIWDTIINANPLIYLFGIAIIALAIWTFKRKHWTTSTNYRMLVEVIVVFLILHTIVPLTLGPSNDELQWNSFKNPKNIYNSYSDCNKSLKVSGLFEYTARNFYFSFLKPDEKLDEKSERFLEKAYTTPASDTKNAYTGNFNGKNLILLQLEGIDDWLLTKKTMPNLYSLTQDSINFKKHYSMYTGGGSTFNSEFAVNTGFTTPLSYVENVYSFSENTFNQSMANIFKSAGYSVNAFHMNSGEFYSRSINYKNWGYDNYYGLKDIKKYSNKEYILDRELILNETFYEKMFKQEGPFVHYIITYSPHTPFTSEKEVGQKLAQEKYPDGNIPEMSEEACAKMAAGETDKMIGLLMQALKDNGLYDNTVIVAFTDHYLYTLEDKTILEKHKGKNANNNLINHTPFFIWSSNTEYKAVNQVTMQTDILPTVLNLFGMNYSSNNYIGSDALDPDYKGFAFFPDYSWYDGYLYVENDEVVNKKKLNSNDKETLKNMNRKINRLIKKNDLTLKYDYFKIKK